MRDINLPACVITDQVECIAMAFECGVYAKLLDHVNDRFLRTGKPHAGTAVVTDGELVLIIQCYLGSPNPKEDGWVIYRFASDELFRQYLPTLEKYFDVRIGGAPTPPTPEASWNN